MNLQAKVCDMLSFPNAKINIGLYITEKRSDGYHNLESAFFPVNWTDGLEIIPASETIFTSSGLKIDGNPDSNLCLKAYQLMEKRFNLPSVQMHLHKVLPMGAGLGGGSADAAHTIKLLDKIFELGLTLEEQEKLARELGSDCAFFIRNKPVFAFDKGDSFDPLKPSLAGFTGVIVWPKLHISTAEAYSKIKPKPAPHNLKTELAKPVASWKDSVKNDFEEALFPAYPVLPELKNQLYGLGALYASMSGSGSAVFGIFENEIDLKNKFPRDYLVWQGLLH